MSDQNQAIITLPPGRVTYPKLLEPEAYQGKGDKFYSVRVYWPKTEFSDRANRAWQETKRAVVECAKQKWGDRANPLPDGKLPYSIPFIDGDDAEKDVHNGYMFRTFKSKFPIGVADLRSGESVEAEPGIVALGSLIVVRAKPYAYQGGLGKGITLYPQVVGVLGDPDPDFVAHFLAAKDGPSDPAAVARAAFAGYQAPAVMKTVTNPEAPPPVAPAEAPQVFAKPEGEGQGGPDDIPF